MTPSVLLSLGRLIFSGKKWTRTAITAAFFGASISAIAAAPANDQFPSPYTNGTTAAYAIPGASGSLTGINIGATTQQQVISGTLTRLEPLHGGNQGGASVWYVWQAPAFNGTNNYLATFNTYGSNFDTLMGVYIGTVVNKLVPAGGAGNDDAAANTPWDTSSAVTFVATPGQFYNIAIDGYNSGLAPAASGTFKLNWSSRRGNVSPSISGIDNFGHPADVITINGTNFDGTTKVQFTGTSGPFSSPAYFTVASPTTIKAVVPPDAATGPITVTIKATGTIGTLTATSAASFNVNSYIPSYNDNIASAQQLIGVAGSAGGDNTSATKEANEPNHAGNPGGASIWYVWTAPSTAIYTFDTIGSSFDTLLAIYTGTNDVTTLTPVVSGDDISNSIPQSRASIFATKGTTYYIAVDGADRGSGPATGTVILNWRKNSIPPSISSFSPPSGGYGSTVTITGAGFLGASASNSAVYFNYNAKTGTYGGIVTGTNIIVDSDTQIRVQVPVSGTLTGFLAVKTPLGVGVSSTQFVLTVPPGNDNFANAFPINAPYYNVGGWNNFATQEPNEPAYPGGLSGGSSVWWTWIAPTSGKYDITTQGSSFDTLLAVYTGTSLNNLQLAAFNDDEGGGVVTSRLTLDAVQGTTYYIAVDGKNGAQGLVYLSVLPQAPPVTTLYATGFEATEGFNLALAGADLAGQAGFLIAGTGNGSDIVQSGTAVLGFGSAPPATPRIDVWRPVNFTPTVSLPIVVFSSDVTISSGGESLFEWRVINQNGRELFAITFDNSTQGVYYRLDNSSNLIYSGINFNDDTSQPYHLVITMDYIHNTWGATLNNVPIASGQPITTQKSALTLGQVSASWVYNGFDTMSFDNYSILALSDLRPQVVGQTQITVNNVPVSGATASVNTGDNVTLSATITGDTPLFYQWSKNGSVINSATNNSAVTNTLALNNIQPNDAGTYTLRASNKWGSIITSPVDIFVNTVPTPPVITQPPQSVTVVPGSTITLSVGATGTPPLSYQWQLSGTNLTGGTGSNLTVNNVQAQNTGIYTVYVMNTSGTTSASGTLSLGLPFSSVVGKYAGLIQPTNADPNMTGLIRIATTKNGSFTGTVFFEGKNFSIKGSFDPAGTWSGFLGFDAAGNPITATLHLNLNPNGDQITGSIYSGNIPATVTGDRNLFSTTNKTPLANRYTMLMFPGMGLPAGEGYATVTVDVAGNVQMSGKLGDGTAVSQGITLSKNGTWPLFLYPYKGAGSVYGTILFDTNQPATDFTSGTAGLKWAKPARQIDTYYPNGFAGTIDAVGSIYNKPVPGQQVLTFSGTANVQLSGGNLSSTITEPITVNSSNQVTATNATEKFKMTITTGNGLLSGSFVPGATYLPSAPTKVLKLNGVIFQKANFGGGGVFLGVDQSGSVQLNP